ncbi:MAG: hypothetical protein N2043_03190 [Ignavibacterium sp.]|nr:hypothetical protein [Ignavibacterium sp.]
MKLLILFTFLSFNVSKNFAQNIESKQLLQLGLILELDGYNLTHEVEFDYLSKGKVAEYNLILYRNMKYVMIATCDIDCGDVDLFLYDLNGNKLAYSDDTSDKPIILFQPTKTQLYKLTVFMYNCSINPCRYGLAVFGK